MRRSRRFNRVETREAADAMIDVDDEITWRERACFSQKMLGSARPAARPNQPVAKNVLLAYDRKTRRLETLLYADDSKPQRARRQAKGLGKRRNRRSACKAVVCEHVGKPLACAIRPRGKDDAFAACLQRAHMADRGIEHIGIWVCPLGGKDSPRL